MEWIQTSADLHLFHLVYRLPLRKDQTALIQCLPPIGKCILYHQILTLLRIDKRRHIRVFRSNDRF